MNFIKTRYFHKQLQDLKKKYPKADKDLGDFESSISSEPFSDLWNGTYKFRIRNSSVPVWKRWGFRMIVLFLNKDTCILLLIYSKNQIENISWADIIRAKSEVLNELNHKS